MQQAAEAVPTVPQYRINVVILDIALQDPILAEQDLQKVAALNRLGNLSPVVDDLKKRIAELKAGAALQPDKKPHRIKPTHLRPMIE